MASRGQHEPPERTSVFGSVFMGETVEVNVNRTLESIEGDSPCGMGASFSEPVQKLANGTMEGIHGCARRGLRRVQVFGAPGFLYARAQVPRASELPSVLGAFPFPAWELAESILP